MPMVASPASLSRARKLWNGVEHVWQDLRHGIRLFAKNPAFTAIAVASIAFGTGANVAIFSVTDTMLLRPLPVAQPSEVLNVGTDITRGKMVFKSASYLDYLDIRARSTTFSGLIAYTFEPVGLTAHRGDAPHVRYATLVTANFFDVLGVPPASGRTLSTDADALDGRDHPEVVLSDAFWRAEFGADRGAIGRTLRVAGIDFTIVGVAPDSFTGLHPYVRDSVFIPLTMWRRIANRYDVDPLAVRDFRRLTIKGRLRAGATIDDARAELGAIGAALGLAYPATNKNQHFVAQTELEHRYRDRPYDASLIVVLTTLAIGVLCVACANVAGLLASRAPVRAREIALRLAVGASRGRLVRQLLTESLGIALAGGVGGIAVGWIGMRMLGQIQFPTDMVSPPPFVMNDRAFVFSLAIAMASAVLVGLGPALQMTRVDLAGAVKATDNGARRDRRPTGRHALVALQVTLSLVLVTIVAFAIELFGNVWTKGPGLRITHMAKLTADPGQARYSEGDATAFFQKLLDDARRLPGVDVVAVTSSMPLFSFNFVSIAPEGFRLPDGQTGVSVWGNGVDEHYFDALDIPILRGRKFEPSDDIGAPRVAIVNENLARHFWPNVDPIGKRFRLMDVRRQWVEVIGIARNSAVSLPGEVPQDALYVPFRQERFGRMTLLATTTGESTALLAPLRQLVAAEDPDVPVSDVQTMETFYETRITSIGRVMIRLVAAMGVIGVALTMVGLYGLVSYGVSRRTREIGIRIAIGASSTRILGMILRQGMQPACVGVAIGLPLTLLTSRWLAAMNPFNYQYNVIHFIVSAPILLAVTLAAAWIPARRAANVQPTVALRCD